MILCAKSTRGLQQRRPRNREDHAAQPPAALVADYVKMGWFHFFLSYCAFFVCFNSHQMLFSFLQIFFDLVRQVNRRTPDKVEKKSKKKCVIL